MNYISHLALYGLLTIAQAEAGYNYAQPQLSLSQLSSSSSYQQGLPQSNHISGQALQQLQLSQSQQSSSYQQSPPQLTQYLPPPSVQYGAPNLQAQPSVQYGVPNLQSQPSVQYGIPILQNSQSSQLLSPQLNLGTSLNIAQGEQNLQPQTQNLEPSLELSQSSLSQQSQGLINLNTQTSFNQISPGLSQQQVLPQLLDQNQNQVLAQGNLPLQLPTVTKYIYVHVAPDEPPPPPVVIPPPPPPQKIVKIIFIKAPQTTASQQQTINLPPPQQPNEEKTLVYVLVNKLEQPKIIVPTPAPTLPSKPEVYFIKYKAQTGTGSVGPGITINSGESSSSLFSGELPRPSTKYGPPEYQK